MWTLLVETGKHKGRQVKLVAERITIGRAEDATIRVASSDVSRYHCELLPTEQGVLVNDLDSVNGTQVNGEAITTEFVLAPGNTLTVGPMSFRLLPKSATDKKGEGAAELSDEDISDLLSGELDLLQSDTSVIGGNAGDEEEDMEPKDQGPWVPPPGKPEFESVAEEAADIIRRHHEMIAAMEADEDSESTPPATV